jgi:hypothetical protein
MCPPPWHSFTRPGSCFHFFLNFFPRLLVFVCPIMAGTIGQQQMYCVETDSGEKTQVSPWVWANVLEPYLNVLTGDSKPFGLFSNSQKCYVFQFDSTNGLLQRNILTQTSRSVVFAVPTVFAPSGFGHTLSVGGGSGRSHSMRGRGSRSFFGGSHGRGRAPPVSIGLVDSDDEEDGSEEEEDLVDSDSSAGSKRSSSSHGKQKTKVRRRNATSPQFHGVSSISDVTFEKLSKLEPPKGGRHGNTSIPLFSIPIDKKKWNVGGSLASCIVDVNPKDIKGGDCNLCTNPYNRKEHKPQRLLVFEVSKGDGSVQGKACCGGISCQTCVNKLKGKSNNIVCPFCQKSIGGYRVGDMDDGYLLRLEYIPRQFCGGYDAGSPQNETLTTPHPSVDPRIHPLLLQQCIQCNVPFAPEGGDPDAQPIKIPRDSKGTPCCAVRMCNKCVESSKKKNGGEVQCVSCGHTWKDLPPSHNCYYSCGTLVLSCFLDIVYFPVSKYTDDLVKRVLEAWERGMWYNKNVSATGRVWTRSLHLPTRSDLRDPGAGIYGWNSTYADDIRDELKGVHC